MIFYITIAAWVSFETLLIISDKEKMNRSQDSSAVILLLCIIGSVVPAILLSNFQFTRLQDGGDPLLIIGASIMWFGMLLRSWAIFCLGNLFSTFITIKSNQRVIKNGPYKFIRHPSYAGSLLTFIGFAISLGTIGGVLIVLILISTGYYQRMNIEEHVLLSSLGEEYGSYMKQAKRLVPLVY